MTKFQPGRRTMIAAMAVAMAFPAIGSAQAEGDPIRIGYTMSRTGPFAGGAQVSQEPNYLLWADKVNEAGGLNVGGTKRKVELIGYDDRSDIETAVRTYQKMMGSDKLDLILPPWGSGMNFAIAPIANRNGYPFIAPTALSRRLIDMKLPYFFSLLQQPDKMMNSVVDMLADQGVKTAATIYMDDLFGLENVAALRAALKERGIELVEDKSYPLGVKDLSPVLKSIKAKEPDAFIAITYPPDTLLASSQSREIEFNPKYYYASVGTAFPLYKQRMGENTEGVLGMGSWNAKVSDGAKAYFDAHVAHAGKEPDRWASGHAWAGLEILQQAIETVGLDRKAIRDHIAGNEFDTILGKIAFKDGENASIPGTVGQWQGDDFEVVWPADRATAKLVAPKPDWK